MFKRKSICCSFNDDEIQKRNRYIIPDDDDDLHESSYIPEDIVVDGILTRLPVESLCRFSCVCKSWNNTISHDPKFASSYSNQSRGKPYLFFTILNLTDNYSGHKSLYDNYVFSNLDDDSSTTSYGLRPMQLLSSQSSAQIVGFCNGLRCIKMLGGKQNPLGRDGGDIYAVLNPSRKEFLGVPRPAIIDNERRIIGYGFGFDSLREEYKLVSLHETESWEFVCSVFTLGASSWRRIATPGTRLTGLRFNHARRAIFCSGDLFWRVTTVKNEAGNTVSEKMLFYLDIHNEKFELIQYPTTAAEQFQVDADQLLEFKGSLCVVFFEKVSTTDRHNHRHCNRYNRYNSCCCCCKIHLYVLKDKDNQTWSTETFDVCINSTTSDLSSKLKGKRRKTSASTYGYPPVPCCGFSCSKRKPRITSFSDRVVLYWFDGGCLQFYDVQMKHLKAVTLSRPGGSVFRSSPPFPSNYLLLGGQGENFISLQTFLPEGEQAISYGQNIFPQYMKRGGEKSLAGYVFLGFPDCSDRRQLWHPKVWVEATPNKEIDYSSCNVSKQACMCKKCRYLQDLRLWKLESYIGSAAEKTCCRMLDFLKEKYRIILCLYGRAELVVARKEANGGCTTSCDKCEAIDVEFVSALRQIILDFDRYKDQVSAMQEISMERAKKISTIDERIQKIMADEKKIYSSAMTGGPKYTGGRSMPLCSISIEIVTDLHKVKASLLKSKIEISQMETQISKGSLIKISEFVGRMKSISGCCRPYSCLTRDYCNQYELDFLTKLVTLECFLDKAHSSALERENDLNISRVDIVLARIE